MECKNCVRIYKESIVHGKDEKCPIAAAGIVCSRCHVRGHFVSDCEEKWPHYTRPLILEELIPIHIRKRYKITTSTPIEYAPRHGTSEEINDINTIVVPMDDKEIRNVMKYYGIGTMRKQDDNIHLLSEYAKDHAMKIKFVKKIDSKE